MFHNLLTRGLAAGGLVAVLAAIGASGSSQNAMSAGAEVGSIRVSLLNRPIGRETYTLTPRSVGAVLEADLDLLERGSPLQVHSRVETGADLAPTHFRSTGKTYRFVNVDVDLDVAALNLAGPVFPAMGYAPLSGRALLIRHWEAIGRPARVGVVPGDPTRAATIERRGTDTVRVGDRDVRLTRYTVNGIVWGRETVWLDEAGRFAALLTRIHILPLESIREDLADQLPVLQASAVQDQMEDLARLARETTPVASGDFAIVGARLIDGSGDAPVEDAVVIVREGRIAAAGPRAAVSVPRGLRTIDARGKTIAPGLWDMHAHASQIEWAPAYLAAGVTSVRDMGGNTKFLTSMRDAIATGRAVGPRMFLAGLIDGEAPGAMGDVAAATPEQGRAIVDAYKAAGFVQIKLYSLLQPDVIGAITARAHELGLSVTGHVPNAVTLARAIELGMDQVAHLPLRGDPASSATRDVIAMLAARHIVIDPTLPWNELLGRPTTTEIESFEPGFMRAPPALILAYRSVRNPGDQARADASRRASGAMVKALFDAGVPIVAGTDGAVPGVSLLRALELYVEAGLTPMQALQTATVVPARALGLEAELGTVAPGRRADLIVLDADPLADISNIRRLHWVVSAGRMYVPSAFEQ